MKKFNKTFTLLFVTMALLFSSQTVNAQCATVVGSSCVGSCAASGYISYNVGPCINQDVVVQLCVATTSSNLCPSHIAIAKVFVNGNSVASAQIQSVGTHITFGAACGDFVEVFARTKHVNPNIQCIVFGDVNFTLNR